MADEIKLSAGEYLLYEGEGSSEMYFVARGTLAIMKKRGQEEKQIGTIYSGEVVGEMSFLDSAPRSASVRALGPVNSSLSTASSLSRTWNPFPPGTRPWFTPSWAACARPTPVSVSS